MEKIKVGAFIPLPVSPTAIVGVNVDGKPNYLTVGFVSGVNIKPPIIGVSLNRRHHSVKGLLENGAFSVNIPSAGMALETDYCGLVSGRSVDKSKIFTPFYGELKTAPMIEECPISCECRYTGQSVDFAMDTIYFGEIAHAYVNRELYKKGKPADILAIDPLLTGLDRRYRRVGEAIGKAFSMGWAYADKRPEGADDGNAVQCEIINRAPKHTLQVECDAQGAGIAGAVQDILNHAASLGAKPSEGPFVTRHEGMAPEADIRVGFVFDSRVKGTTRIIECSIKGGRYCRCVHTGPYDTLGKTMDSLRVYVEDSGFKAAEPEYEFYLNDPASTPPDELRTMLLIPVKRGN